MVKKTKKSLVKSKKKELDFKAGFKFPFNNAVRLWNILWFLLPIIGWLALGGYSIRIVKQFVKGNFKELPPFNFTENLELGFFMFFKALPFVIAFTILSFILEKIPVVGTAVSWIISIFIVPVLMINFYKKETIASYFEFDKVKYVFEHIGEYIIALLKTIVLFIVFGIMSIILVGIPALVFTQHIFLADFYRRHVK